MCNVEAVAASSSEPTGASFNRKAAGINNGMNIWSQSGPRLDRREMLAQQLLQEQEQPDALETARREEEKKKREEENTIILDLLNTISREMRFLSGEYACKRFLTTLRRT